MRSVRHPAGCMEDCVTGQPFVVAGYATQCRTVTLDLADFCVEPDADALRSHLFREEMTEVCVEILEQAIAAVHQGRVDTQTVEYGCKLNRNIAAPDDDDAPRQRVEIEGIVRGNAVFRAFNVRYSWMASRRDQNILRRECAAVHVN